MTATTDATRSRRRPAPLRATVSQRTQLSPHLVRVTVTGPALAGFAYPGPASHFKLLLPAPGTGELILPTPGDDGLVSFDPAAPRARVGPLGSAGRRQLGYPGSGDHPGSQEITPDPVRHRGRRRQ
jgi:hypothetical protein